MTIDEVADKTVETLKVSKIFSWISNFDDCPIKLLDILTSLIDDPVGAKPSQVENWLWVCLYQKVISIYYRNNFLICSDTTSLS